MSPAATSLPPGGTVPQALTLDVPPSGVSFLTNQGLKLIPPQVEVPTLNGSQSCVVDTLNYSVYEPNPNTPNDGLHVAITSATVSPNNGYFDLSFSASLNGTGSDTPPGDSLRQNTVTQVQYSGCSTSCNSANGHYAVITLDPTPVSVTTKLYLTLTTSAGNPVIVAHTPLSTNDINLSVSNANAYGCAAISFFDIVKYFMDQPVKQMIVDQVNQKLIPAIEQGFKAARFDQDVSLGGSTMHVKILPSALAIVPSSGVAISMSSEFDTTPTSCVPIDPSAGSNLTAGGPPSYGANAPDGNPYDLAASLSDNLANQALFSVWRAGTLCRTISQLGGNTLDSSMLSLLGLSGATDELGIPSGSPIELVIKAYDPPTATYGGAHQINVGVKQLELSIFAQVQERWARIVAVDLDITDAGVDLAVNANNVLGINLTIDPSSLSATDGYDEPVGQAQAAALINELPTLLQTLGPQLANALPSINLGNLAGVGFVNTRFIPEQGVGGTPDDTLSVYTGLSPAPGGCTAANGGCGLGSGSTGCSLSASADGGNAAALFGMALLSLGTIWVRRRPT